MEPELLAVVCHARLLVSVHSFGMNEWTIVKAGCVLMSEWYFCVAVDGPVSLNPELVLQLGT